MLIDNLSLTVDNQHIGNHLDAQLALQFAVRVEEYGLVRPLMLVDERLYFIDVLSLVDADSDEFYASFVLPIFINLTDIRELAQAWVAPCGEERDQPSVPMLRAA